MVLSAALCGLAGFSAAHAGAQPEGQPTPGSVAAAAGTTQPTTANTDVTPTPIIVREVKGKVGYRLKADGKTQPAKVGDVLTEGTVLFLGADGLVKVQVGMGQLFTIDRLSKVELREAINAAGKERTTLDVTYGRVDFKVTSGAIANDVQIATPDSTLAIKGTEGGVEVVAGQPTLAYGGRLNRGRFIVSYPGRAVANITSSEQSDAKTPDPARKADLDQYVEIGDGLSRYGDEFEFVFDFNTVFQRVFDQLDAQGLGVAPALDGIFTVDEATGKIVLYDPFPDDPKLPPLVAGTPSNFNLSAQEVGLALRRTATGTQLLRLESNNGFAQLLGFDLGGGIRPARVLGEFQSGESASPGNFVGLAVLDGQIYSSLITSGRVVRLNPGQNTFTTAVDLGATIEPGLGAFSQRGTLLIPGRLPQGTGLSNGLAGFFGDSAMILEVDPRTNYLSRALSDVTDDFAVVDFDTVVDPRVDPFSVTISDQRFAGLARSEVTFGGGVGIFTQNFVLQVNINALVDGVPTTIAAIVNGDSARVIGDVPLRVVGPSPVATRDLAGEAAATAASATLLDAPTSIDTFLTERFATLAYSQLAYGSGVVERLVRNQVLATSVDPSGCLASGALDNLDALLGNRVQQRSGVGGSVFDFRRGLSPSHPCLAPGQVGAQQVAGFTYLFLDEENDQIVERDLVGNSRTVRSGLELSGLTGLADAALWPDPRSGNARTLLVLDNGDAFGSVLRAVNLDSTSQDEVLDRFDDIENDRVFRFDGLATLGSRIFASGRQIFPDALGEVSVSSARDIFELQPLSAPGEPVVRMSPQFLVESLAGAPARGSVFAIGRLPTVGGPFGFGTNAVLLEVDPRNNYVAFAHSALDGDFNVQAGTRVNGSVMPSDVRSVTGLAYVGNTLVISGLDGDGRRVVVQYNPGASNAPLDPRFRRLDEVTMGPEPTGLGSETPAIPLGSVSFGSSPGQVETGPGVNTIFQQMAYSQQAARSMGFQALVGEHIAVTSVNPAGCRASGALTSTTFQNILAQNAGRRNGVGQTIITFRAGLAPEHPCRRPSGPG
jgi:hypothetical protein